MLPKPPRDRNSLLETALGLGLLLAASIPSVYAANDTWDGTTDATWATGTNWALDSAVAPGTIDTATFDNAGNSFTTIDLGTGVTIGSILFDSANAAAYTIGSGVVGSQTLTLGTVGNAITVNAAVANNQLFNANLALATTGTYTVANNSLTNSLTLAGGISATSAGIKVLQVTGSGNTAISGAITAGTGSMNLFKTGSGTLTLSGGGAFSGNGVNGYLPGSALFPVVLREGTTRITGGTYTVGSSGEFVVGGVVTNGGAGTNTSFVMDGGTLSGVGWLSIGRGNGVGGASSDITLNNSASISSENFSAGFNAGQAANLPKGSLTMNNSSTYTITGGNRSVNIAESVGSNIAVTLGGSSVFNAGDSQVRIGQGGTGTLTLSGTSHFNIGATNRLTAVGTNNGGNGLVTLNGSSTFTHTANITSIGEAGTGVFNIASSTATANVRNLVIGRAGTNTSVGAVYNRGTILGIGADGVFMGDGAGSTSYFLNDNASAAVANATAATIAGGIGNNSNAVIDVAGGTLSGTRVGAGFFQNTNATNTQYNVTGGELAAGATGFLVGDDANKINKWANVNVTGGIFSSVGAINLSNANNAANTALLSIKTGGTVSADTITGGVNANTFVNFDGGTLRANSGTSASLVTANIDRMTVQSGGATFDTNGFNKSIDTVIAAPDANGTTTFGVTSISLGATGTGFEGRPIVKITGGGGTGATAVANFDVATGQVTGITITSAGSGYTSAPTVTIIGGGGTALTATASTGAVAGGGITKDGAGKLTLTANSTYTGATLINNGILAVDGTLNGTSGTAIAAGATLGGSGNITTGTVSFTGAGFINAGNSVGTLGVAAADLGGGTLKVEFDTGTINLIDLFSIAGLLDIGGATVDFDDIGNDLDGTSSYVFASYGSLFGGTFASVIDLPTGYTINYGTGTNSTLALVPVPESGCALLGGLGCLLLLRRRRSI